MLLCSGWRSCRMQWWQRPGSADEGSTGEEGRCTAASGGSRPVAQLLHWRPIGTDSFTILNFASHRGNAVEGLFTTLSLDNIIKHLIHLAMIINVRFNAKRWWRAVQCRQPTKQPLQSVLQLLILYSAAGRTALTLRWCLTSQDPWCDSKKFLLLTVDTDTKVYNAPVLFV